MTKRVPIAVITEGFLAGVVQSPSITKRMMELDEVRQMTKKTYPKNSLPDPRTIAARVEEATANLNAWGWGMFPPEYEPSRKHTNQFGTSYVFRDGSHGFVKAGEARLLETRSNT